jgi:protocatechuate 3,4-dioxygenase beta subunit
MREDFQMREFNEQNATDAVIARMVECPDPRLKQVMTSIIRHLHAVVREVEPTQAEWMTAIEFLTATGQMCSPTRQEFILLSDTLGVSMLVDAIHARRLAGGTQSTVLGPFYVEGAPERINGADLAPDVERGRLVVRGRVLDTDGQPVEGAIVDTWHTNQDGFYDVQKPGEIPPMSMRGRFRTDGQGAFWYRTICPSSYPIPDDGTVGRMLAALARHPWRPAHIHFILEAPGYESVTTHLFLEGDRYLDSDAVFAVKESLIVPVQRCDDPEEARRLAMTSPFSLVTYDFRLKPVALRRAT